MKDWDWRDFLLATCVLILVALCVYGIITLCMPSPDPTSEVPLPEYDGWTDEDEELLIELKLLEEGPTPLEQAIREREFHCMIARVWRWNQESCIDHSLPLKMPEERVGWRHAFRVGRPLGLQRFPR
jgi:hypothetical protein